MRLSKVTAKVAVDLADATVRATELAKEKIQASSEKTKQSARILGETFKSLSEWGSRKD